MRPSPSGCGLELEVKAKDELNQSAARIRRGGRILIRNRRLSESWRGVGTRRLTVSAAKLPTLKFWLLITFKASTRNSRLVFSEKVTFLTRLASILVNRGP